jgi:predicted nuclease with RNAse H fold
VARWLGIDVGGERKGHDVAVVDDRGLAALAGGLGLEAVLELVGVHRPVLVAVDSPRCCAPDGLRARESERTLNRLVCGIRWTPDAIRLQHGSYYAWIRAGLALFAALDARGADTIEVFPTASWTRWFGPRGPATRSRWSREGLARLGLRGVPSRTNQDQRDAIAAAVTARQHTDGMTDSIGEIVVPSTRYSAPRPARSTPSAGSR